MGSLNTCPKCRALLEPGTKRCPYCETDVRHLDALSPTRDAEATSHFGVWLLTLNLAMYLLTVFLDPAAGSGEGPLEPSSASLITYGACHTGLIQGCGQYWRLLTAIFLHGGILHLLMNSVAVFVLLPMAAVTFGVHRTIVLYLVTGVASFYVSQSMGGFSVGASGALCGLIGALLVWGHRRGGFEGRALKQRMLMWALYIFLIGQFFDNIDNWGHGGGFVAGLVLGWIAARVRMPGGREDRLWRLASIVVVAASLAVAGAYLVPNAIRGQQRRDIEIHRSELRRILGRIEKVLDGEVQPSALPAKVPEGPGGSEAARAAIEASLERARIAPGTPEATIAFADALRRMTEWQRKLVCSHGIFPERR